MGGNGQVLARMQFGRKSIALQNPEKGHPTIGLKNMGKEGLLPNHHSYAQPLMSIFKSEINM